jgi:hypothetical protein
MEPFFYIERCLLKILKGSGWGEISIEFEKGKRGKLVVMGRMTISDRFIISPTV